MLYIISKMFDFVKDNGEAGGKESSEVRKVVQDAMFAKSAPGWGGLR